MDYMDLTLSAHKTAANMLAMVEAASQMTITTVLFVRTGQEQLEAMSYTHTCPILSMHQQWVRMLLLAMCTSPTSASTFSQLPILSSR